MGQSVMSGSGSVTAKFCDGFMVSPVRCGVAEELSLQGSVMVSPVGCGWSQMYVTF